MDRKAPAQNPRSPVENATSPRSSKPEEVKGFPALISQNSTATNPVQIPATAAPSSKPRLRFTFITPPQLLIGGARFVYRRRGFAHSRFHRSFTINNPWVGPRAAGPVAENPRWVGFGATPGWPCLSGGIRMASPFRRHLAEFGQRSTTIVRTPLMRIPYRGGWKQSMTFTYRGWHQEGAPWPSRPAPTRSPGRWFEQRGGEQISGVL